MTQPSKEAGQRGNRSTVWETDTRFEVQLSGLNESLSSEQRSRWTDQCLHVTLLGFGYFLLQHLFRTGAGLSFAKHVMQEREDGFEPPQNRSHPFGLLP